MPTAFVTVVMVSNDRMRGIQFSSCKMTLSFRFGAKSVTAGPLG